MHRHRHESRRIRLLGRQTKSFLSLSWRHWRFGRSVTAYRWVIVCESYDRTRGGIMRRSMKRMPGNLSLQAERAVQRLQGDGQGEWKNAPLSVVGAGAFEFRVFAFRQAGDLQDTSHRRVRRGHQSFGAATRCRFLRCCERLPVCPIVASSSRLFAASVQSGRGARLVRTSPPFGRDRIACCHPR